MEMICASVCFTSMICFTLEWKHRCENPFDEKVHMGRHRMGARGNATSFPLPWEAMLQELGRTEAASVAPDLPWVGDELADRVSVMLKTRDEDDPKACAHLVHQATVRRGVVVQLIEGAVRRRHRAYASVSLDRVREKALRLPESGVPPEIVQLLQHDADLDKVQVQKAATPVPGRTDVATAAASLGQGCPNAVVLEKSSTDDSDINAQRIAALRHLRDKLQGWSERNPDAQRFAPLRPHYPDTLVMRVLRPWRVPV